MKLKLKNLAKSDLLYSLLFLGFYLWFFLNPIAGIFFAVGFLGTYTIVKVKHVIKKYPLLIIPITLATLIIGYVYSGTYELVGFLIGSSVAGFMLGNIFTSVKTSKINDDTLINLQEIIKITSLTQVLFSLYYFYSLIIQDVRGQNKLETDLVFIGVCAFVTIIPLTQILVKKLLYKRLDVISYINILFITVIGVVFATLYSAFVEIGIHNVLLPSIYTAGGILLISVFVTFSKDKQYKFKRTLSSLLFVGVPLILMLYYPWETSGYLGVMAATLTLVLFLPNLFLCGKDLEVTYRITNTYVLVVNIYLILMALFSLSSKGIIARLNIANIDYLLMLMFGIFVIMFLSDIKDAVHSLLRKYHLSSTYSILMVALTTFLCYLILDLGGIEGIGSFLFGIAGYTFIKDSFQKTNENKPYELAYTYLEDNLLNLLTVLTLSLILVKI